MALLKVNPASLISVANALRTAANTEGTLTFPAGFVSAIESLSSGGSGGTPVAIGVQNVAQTASFTVSGLPFTPTNALLVLVRRSVTKGVLVSAVSDSGYTEATANGEFTNATSGLITNIGSNNFTFGQDSMTYTCPSSFNVYGVYFYLIWRSEEAQS